METKITKVICEGDMVFSNGSMLAKKGTLNLVLLAASYNLPIVGCTGSWNYNGWSPFSYEALAAKYGTNTMGNYDWIDSRWLSSLVLEIGTILPPRIYQSLTHVYKKDLTTIPW